MRLLRLSLMADNTRWNSPGRQPCEQRQKDIHPSSTQQFTEGRYFLDGTKFETLFSSANTDGQRHLCIFATITENDSDL